MSTTFIAHARKVNALIASGAITAEQGRNRITQYLSGGLLAKLPTPRPLPVRTTEIAAAIASTLAEVTINDAIDACLAGELDAFGAVPVRLYSLVSAV